MGSGGGEFLARAVDGGRTTGGAAWALRPRVRGVTAAFVGRAV